MPFKEVARAAREEEKAVFAQVDSDDLLDLEAARTRVPREEARETTVAEAARAMQMWNATIVENLGITKAIARTNHYAIIAEERATNQAVAPILRKLVRARHHHLGKRRVQEKGLMESAGGPSKQQGAQPQWLC